MRVWEGRVRGGAQNAERRRQRSEGDPDPFLSPTVCPAHLRLGSSTTCACVWLCVSARQRVQVCGGEETVAESLPRTLSMVMVPLLSESILSNAFSVCFIFSVSRRRRNVLCDDSCWARGGGDGGGSVSGSRGARKGSAHVEGGMTLGPWMIGRGRGALHDDL